MIPQLVQTALAHNVPFSFITGRLEAGTTSAQRDYGWRLNEFKADWRPAGKSEFAVGRLIPTAVLPSFDQEEVNSGLGKALFTHQQQHRINLRVPQRVPFNQAEYQEAREVVDSALELFARFEMEGRIVRLLATPNSYTTFGGGLNNNIAVTTQHMPLAVEDYATGELLWVHPEAEYIVAGGRLGGGQANTAVLPTPGAAGKSRRRKAAPPPPQDIEGSVVAPPRPAGAPVPPPAPAPAPASPLLVPASKPEEWYPALVEEVKSLQVPEANHHSALVKLRARHLMAVTPGMNTDLALLQAEKDILAAQPVVADHSWLGPLQAEAEELGIPQKAQVGYVIGVRSKQIQAQQGITALEADSLAATEVQEALKGSKHHSRAAKGGSTPSADAGDTEETPRELLELKAFVDRKEISIVKIAELINMSQSVTSRYFSGSRGARGLHPMILGQFAMITAALKAKQPLPAPLPKTARKAAGAPARVNPTTPSEKV